MLNSRRALYRVFVSPIEPRQASMAISSALRPAPQVNQAAGLQNPAFLPLLALASSQTRGFVKRSRPPRGARGNDDDALGFNDDDGPQYDRRFTTRETIARSGRDRMPRDHEITDPQIRVLDNGSIEGPLATRFVLTKLDSSESLRMIEPYVPADAQAGTPARYALCKIVNKRDEYQQEKLRKEQKKISGGGGTKTKEVEMSWTIGPHDLATKTRQIGGFLDKGFKVELVMGKKKRGKQATPEEIKAVLDKIKEEVDVHGGRETRPQEGTVGATLRMYFEGPSKKS